MRTRPLEQMAEKAGRYAYRLGQGEIHVEALLRELDRAYEGREMPEDVRETLGKAINWSKGGPI